MTVTVLSPVEAVTTGSVPCFFSVAWCVGVWQKTTEEKEWNVCGMYVRMDSNGRFGRHEGYKKAQHEK